MIFFVIWVKIVSNKSNVFVLGKVYTSHSEAPIATSLLVLFLDTSL